MYSMSARLSESDIHCIHAFFPTGRFKSNSVTFADFVHQACCVNKDFLFGRVVYNEAKAFGRVEKFYCSGVHLKEIEIKKLVMWPENRDKYTEF